MIRVLKIAALVFVQLVIPSVALAQASTPQAIKVQGYLTQNGTPVNGPATIGFALFDTDFPGGTNLASIAPQSVTVSNGIYEVELGFGSSLFSGSSRFLEITVNGQTLTPRMHLVSTPFAYQAETLDGFEGTAFVKKAGDTMTGNLSVQGTVESTTAGFRFPDGTTQTSAANLAAHLAAPDPHPVYVKKAGDTMTGTLSINGGSLNVNGGNLTVNGAAALRNPSAALRWVSSTEGAPGDFRWETGSTNFYLYEQLGAASGAFRIFVPYNSGKIGIGTTAPTAALDVNGTLKARSQLSIDLSQFTGVNGRDALSIIASPDNTAGDILVNKPTLTFWSSSNQRHADVEVGVLKIFGGSDLAEPFPISGSAAPPVGAVLIIDEANQGQLRISGQPYDRRVAGVLSGAGGVNPGLTLSQKDVLDSGYHVALAGRVYALADASNGEIQPGDLLTTSARPGHAMKVTDYKKAQGAVIGKAMSRLDPSTGLVLVLVNLQ